MNNIRFKIIAGKINKIPEFCTFCPKTPDYLIRQWDRGQAEAVCLRPKPNLRGWGQIFEAEAEAKILASRPLYLTSLMFLQSLELRLLCGGDLKMISTEVGPVQTIDSFSSGPRTVNDHFTSQAVFYCLLAYMSVLFLCISFYIAMLHRVRYRYGKSSVCLSIRDVEVSLSHRMDFLENNFTVS